MYFIIYQQIKCIKLFYSRCTENSQSIYRYKVTKYLNANKVHVIFFLFFSDKHYPYGENK